MKLQKIAYTGSGRVPEVPVFSGNPPQAKKNRKDAQKRRDKRTMVEQNDLPPTTKIIKSSNGSVVYIIGTIHGHAASVKQVRAIIEQTQPDFVMIEMCNERVEILYNGMESEFTAAKMVANSVPSCRVILGDIPESVFEARLKFEGWKRSFNDHGTTTDFEILTRKCHQNPALAKRFIQVSNEMRKHLADYKLDDESFVNEYLKLLKEGDSFLPIYINITINERNTFMSKVLQELSKIDQPGKAKRTFAPPVIVAIVGLAHRDGIVDILQTNSVQEDVQDLLTLPIGPVREAIDFKEVEENFASELAREQMISSLNNFNVQN